MRSIAPAWDTFYLLDIGCYSFLQQYEREKERCLIRFGDRIGSGSGLGIGIGIGLDFCNRSFFTESLIRILILIINSLGLSGLPLFLQAQRPKRSRRNRVCLRGPCSNFLQSCIPSLSLIRSAERQSSLPEILFGRAEGLFVA